MTQEEYRKQLEKKQTEGYQLDIRLILLKAVQYFKASPLLFFAFSAMVLSLNLFSMRAQPLGSIITVFVQPALMAGYYYVADKIDHGQKITFYDFFEGFNSWVNIFVGVVLAGLLVAGGLFLLIVPGLYLAVAYVFLLPFLVTARFSYWEAMEASRKLVTKNFLNILGLVAALVLINFLGIMFFGVGILVSLPLSYLSIHAAFKTILNPTEEEFRKGPTKIDFSHFR
ncbi:MAG: hypothetical protein R6T91_04820 [Bacteroidales bacterium]